LNALWLVLGLILLLGGGEALVKGSVAVATRLGVSKLMIGLTLVGFGTSTPELVASLKAALEDAPGVAVGNIVGSNICNVLLILGAAAIIYPITTSPRAFRRDGTVVIAASLAMTAVAFGGHLGREVGALFLVLLAAFTTYTYFTEREGGDPSGEMHAAEADDVNPGEMSLGRGLLVALAGMAAVMFGADLLVDAAIEIATDAGISEAVIGLTLVAIGTSLPELVTSVMAALRRHGDVAIGNVIGSNIFNILGIGGVTAVVSPIEIPQQIIDFDVWAMVGSAVLMVIFAVTNWRISRKEGAALLALYGAYLATQLWPPAREALGLI